MNAAAIINELVVIFGISGGAIVGAVLLAYWQTERNYGSRKTRWPKPKRHNRKR